VPARYVPPSGFGYPLDGLLPSDPSPVFFHTGSAPGIHPSEHNRSMRHPVCYHPDYPTYRFNPSVLPPPKRWAGPTGPGFWDSSPSRAPDESDRGLACRPRAALLGFALLGPMGRNLARDFARCSSHALRRDGLKPLGRRSRVSISSCSASS